MFTDQGVGGNHALTVYPDGTVWASGYNAYGQLGDNSLTTRITPVQVIGLTDIVSVASGSDFSLALKSDGTVYSWGNNTSGQLGDDTLVYKKVAIMVPDLADVVAIAAGNAHSLALKKDGTVWSWGNNGSGELGIGSTTRSTVPVQITTDYYGAAFGNVKQIACGGQFCMALLANGDVWSWGNSSLGQIGNTGSQNKLKPIQTVISNIIDLKAGIYHAVALKVDGTVWTWGDNSCRQLGDGSTATKQTAPVQVSGMTNAIQVVAGGYTTGCLKVDGTAWGWGNNNTGQVGDGTAGNGMVPAIPVGDQVTIVPLPSQVLISDVTALTMSLNHSFALKGNGEVWSWAKNNYGQLGDGTTTYRLQPAFSFDRG